MLKLLFNKLSNPLLFYVDKSGRSVFKNYAVTEADGYIFNEPYSLQEAGKALEYRMESDKKLTVFCWIITIGVYLLFINLNPDFFVLFLCIILWCALIYGGRYFASNFYENFMKDNYGNFKITNFNPPVSDEKKKVFKKNFLSKIILTTIMIILFFTPALLIEYIMKFNIKSSHPYYRTDIVLGNIYNAIYPKKSVIYDISAYAKYKTEDYEGAIKDYKKIFKLTGSKFSNKDYTRFANIMFLHKKLHGSQTAIDVFNEYSTKKKMKIMEESQMLWIKSLFSINNDLSQFVVQDYDNLLLSLKDKDVINRFYITSDKAYMLYLMKNYKNALDIYDELIKFVQLNKNVFLKELPRLYIERGFTKRRLGDYLGADDDFVKSEINMYDIKSYEQNYGKQGYIIDKF